MNSNIVQLDVPHCDMRKYIQFVVIFNFIQYFVFAYARSSPTPQPIIIDTDIFSDVDDVGALAIANILHNRGLADLKGVVINTESRYGALAASVISTYYTNPTIPLAALRPLSNATFLDTWTYTLSEYATKLAFNFPRSLACTTQTPDPLTLYRTLLASPTTSPASVNLISIGFLTNLAALLTSPPDHISPLSGHDLIVLKVSSLTIMGGAYPSGWEYNFSGGGNSTAARAILTHWPPSIPITYSGLELGASIISGSNLSAAAPACSPVRAAYEWYVGRCETARESWDPVTVLYGVLGLDGSRWGMLGLRPPFRYGNVEGYNSIVGADGSNAWVFNGKDRGQHWLELAEGIEPEDVARVIDGLLAQGPEEDKVEGKSLVVQGWRFPDSLCW